MAKGQSHNKTENVFNSRISGATQRGPHSAARTTKPANLKPASSGTHNLKHAFAASRCRQAIKLLVISAVRITYIQRNEGSGIEIKKRSAVNFQWRIAAKRYLTQ